MHGGGNHIKHNVEVVNILLFISFLLTVASTSVYAANISVDVSDELGPVNYKVLGTIISGAPQYNHVNAQGLWDPDAYSSVPATVAHLQDSGSYFIRFPGTYSAYNWKHAVGPVDKRPKDYWGGAFNTNNMMINFNTPIKFGLPESLQLCDDVGAVLIMGVPEDYIAPQDAAEMVEYLNSPCLAPDCTVSITNEIEYSTVCDNLCNNGICSNWPQARVCDKYALGRTDLDEPWNVEWFEYGNESNSRWLVDDYIKNFNAYHAAMTGIDNSIKLGAVLENYAWASFSLDTWDEKVIQGTSETAGFYITHMYTPKYTSIDEGDGATHEMMLQHGLAGTHAQLEDYYRKLNMLILDLTGREVPIAVTEFNSGLSSYPSYPPPLHVPQALLRLGTGLINADMIRQLMHADNIALATHWGYMSMIKPSGGLYNFRPTFYPFQFYNNYFGDILLDADVVVEDEALDTYTIDVQKYTIRPASGTHQDEVLAGEILEGIPWTIDNPQPPGVLNVQEDPAGVLTVEFDSSSPLDVDYFHSRLNTTAKPGKWYRLTGLIKTMALTSNEGIFIGVKSGGNLVSNSGFENGFTNWLEPQAGQPAGASRHVETNPALVYSGAQSARIDFAGTHDVNYWQTYQSIDADSDITYLLEGYIRTNAITSNNGVVLFASDSSGGWTTEKMAGTNDWTYISRPYTSGQGVQQVLVQISRLGGGGVISGSAWFDDIKITNFSQTPKIKGNTGTDDYWSYVTVDFKTKSTPDNINDPGNADDDTVNIEVYAGRNAGGGPVSGTAMIKDVRLRELTRGNFGAVPYLSVNASRTTDSNLVYLMVINKSLTDGITSPINLTGFDPVSARSWTMNATSIDTSNERGVIYNPGFEDPWLFSDWIAVPRQGISLHLDENVSHIGSSKSVRYDFDGTNVSYASTYQNIYVEPDTTYIVEGYGKASNIGPNLGMNIQVNHGSLITSSGKISAADWVKESVEFTTDSNTNKIKILLVRHAVSPIQGSTWWDDFTIRKTDGQSHERINITFTDIGSVINGFQYTFPKHSLTAIEISGCIDSDGDGYSPNGGSCGEVDCDDSVETGVEVNPGATEVCDGEDNDCNGTVDDNLTDTGGACSAGVGACEVDGIEVCSAGVLQCNAEAGIGGAEICNNIDDDCNGITDDGITADEDGDGYSAVGSCGGSADDCDDNIDSGAGINPGATEVCDGVDNNCDGDVDEGCICTETGEITIIPQQLSGNPIDVTPLVEADNADDLWYTISQGSISCDVVPEGTYIEAEDYSETLGGLGNFVEENTVQGYSGSGYLRSNGSGGGSCPPAYEGKGYSVYFPGPGVYNVWVRGYAGSGKKNSIFIGVDGQCRGSLKELVLGQWVWTSTIQNGLGTIEVDSEGWHEVNLWIRENGHLVDAIYITTGTDAPGAVFDPVIDPTDCAMELFTGDEFDALFVETFGWSDGYKHLTVTGNDAECGTELAPGTGMFEYNLLAFEHDTLSITDNTPIAGTDPLDGEPGLVMQRFRVESDSVEDAAVELATLDLEDMGTATAILNAMVYISPDMEDFLPVGAVMIGETGLWDGSATTIGLDSTVVVNTDPLYIYIVYDLATGQAGETVQSEVLAVGAVAPDDVIGSAGGSNELLIQGCTPTGEITIDDEAVLNPDAQGKVDVTSIVTPSDADNLWYMVKEGSGSCEVLPGGTYIDAENFTGTVEQGTAVFVEESAVLGHKGSGYLRSSGGSGGGCPAVHEGKEYLVKFPGPGTYKVWVRGYAANGKSNSIFIGLDGECRGSLKETVYGQWVWSSATNNGVNTIEVDSEGEHIINIWIRENGHLVDGIYITTGNETPTDSAFGTEVDPTDCNGELFSGGEEDAQSVDATQWSEGYKHLVVTGEDAVCPVLLPPAVGGFMYQTCQQLGSISIDAGQVLSPDGLGRVNLTSLVDTTNADELWYTVTEGSAVCEVVPGGTYIEAEHYTETVDQGTAVFVEESGVLGHNGSGYLRSSGGAGGGCPAVHEGKEYLVKFPAAGTYKVWVRGYAANGKSNSIFIGFDGECRGSIKEVVFNQWVWTNATNNGVGTISVPAGGEYVINLWIRENGHLVDGIYITTGSETPTDSAYGTVINPNACGGVLFSGTEGEAGDVDVSGWTDGDMELEVTGNDAQCGTALPPAVEWFTYDSSIPG